MSIPMRPLSSELATPPNPAEGVMELMVSDYARLASMKQEEIRLMTLVSAAHGELGQRVGKFIVNDGANFEGMMERGRRVTEVTRQKWSAVYVDHLLVATQSMAYLGEATERLMKDFDGHQVRVSSYPGYYFSALDNGDGQLQPCAVELLGGVRAVELARGSLYIDNEADGRLYAARLLNHDLDAQTGDIVVMPRGSLEFVA